MIQKLLMPVPITLDTDRARALLEKVRRRVSEGKVSSHGDLLREAMNTLDQFYSELSKPTVQARTLSKNEPRDPEVFNLFGEEVLNDLMAGYNTARTLSQAIVAGFNFTSTHVSRLEGKVQKITAKSQDLQHVTGVFTEDIISAGDDFADNSKIDMTRVPEGDRADFLPGTGMVLKRQQVSSVMDGAKIEITSNVGDLLYEGKFYALEGEAEPEGGQFHFKKSRTPSKPATAPKQSTSPTPIEPRTILERLRQGTFLDFSDRLGRGGQTTGGGTQNNDLSGLADLLTPAETDAGAPEEDLEAARASILDGNPDTYWQGEYVIDIARIEPDDLEYQELVAALSVPDVDLMDLEVEILFTFQDERFINFITLDPLNVGDGAWLEVTDISTSVDRTEWDVIEGLHDHNYENILTDEANEELNEREVAMTLAPNKYQYAGKGVWTFPGRVARYLRVRLVQRVPVPAPYDVLVASLIRHVTDTVTKEKNKSFLSGIFG